MMVNAESVTSQKLGAAIKGVMSAHEAIRKGIATHAQKHEAELNEKRKQTAHARRIAHGIAKHNAKL